MKWGRGVRGECLPGVLLAPAHRQFKSWATHNLKGCEMRKWIAVFVTVV